MGSNKYLKPLIIRLRKDGKTYSEIRSIYNISKGTLSYWLKNITIPQKDRMLMQKRTYEKWKKGNEIFIEKRIREAKKIRDDAKQKAAKEIKNINLKQIGSALFWAEGGKKQRNHIRFSNSDPEIIKIMMRLFREICHITDKKIKARAHIYPQMDYQKIIRFWSKITKLPKKNFYPPQFQISRASKRKRQINTLPYGTLHLTAGNTESACRVKGWIQGIINHAQIK